ncbi:MAG: ABC transporter substrate-binding protein, partial [Desulfitobacterium hafniense]
MRRKSFFSLVLSLVLVLALSTGCGQKNTANPGDSQPGDTLTIGSMTIEENLPVLVAQQNGYFAEQNLEVKLLTFQSPVELQSAFQTGQLD